MATLVYNVFKQKSAQAVIDLDDDQIDVALLMTDTTADTENTGIDFVGDFTTLDEFDGSGYSRKTLASTVVNRDDPNARAEFDADDVAFGNLGIGTRLIQGILLLRQVTNDADSEPIAFIEFSENKCPDGSQFTVQWDAEGILQLA